MKTIVKSSYHPGAPLGFIVFAAILLFCFSSCKNNPSAGEDGDQTGEVITPVTVAHITVGPVADNIFLNAVSVFRKKSIIRSNVNGYIEREMVSPGQSVRQGEQLFVLKTKEANALGNITIDSSLQFKGSVPVKANQNGYISQLDHQQGDYVMDGEQLCIIADQGSFAFILEVPFELSPYVKTGRTCDIILSDGQHITGNIASKLPSVDPVSQTQQYIVRISPQLLLPENLIAKIKITRAVIPYAIQLPKTALLTNVDQTQWWVMKMINDSTAVKVPVEKGIQSDSTVQIISPEFSPSDRVLTSGNYGLPDTALVRVQP